MRLQCGPLPPVQPPLLTLVRTHHPIPVITLLVISELLAALGTYTGRVVRTALTATIAYLLQVCP